jgi:hypothetical protein
MIYLDRKNLPYSFLELTKDSGVEFLEGSERTELEGYLDKIILDKSYLEVKEVCSMLKNSGNILEGGFNLPSVHEKLEKALEILWVKIQNNDLSLETTHAYKALKILSLNISKYMIIVHLKSFLKEEEILESSLDIVDSDKSFLNAIYFCNNSKDLKKISSLKYSIKSYLKKRKLGLDAVYDKLELSLYNRELDYLNLKPVDSRVARDIAIYELVLRDIKMLEILSLKEVNYIVNIEGEILLDYDCCLYSFIKDVERVLDLTPKNVQDILFEVLKVVNTKKSFIKIYREDEEI